ncbi:MAG: PmoA family protein [Bacteroidales bacterium]|nr:PmoA family protein [Bacteroidales bacterium]
MMKKFSAILLAILIGVTTLSAQAVKVKLVRDDSQRKVDVMVDGKLFTSYQYPQNMEKPYLYPVVAPSGSVVTRGFPLDPRKGERVDHPHHVGIWFNHGNVNGLDFWNNSSAIPAERKSRYGHIVVKEVVKAKSGKKAALSVISEWKDNSENTLLVENTLYIFSADKNSRTIDHISTLTAANGTVTITDNKEGMFAIRVDRAFEMPTNQPAIYTDAMGNPEKVRATDNTGVTGMYVSSSGKKGDDVWSSRNDWVLLSGTKDNVLTTMGVFDHPKNTGYPAHSHARGYGLFSTNNLGAQSYVKDHAPVVVTLEKGQSITLRHRFYLTSGAELTADKANQIFSDFSKLY